MLVRSSGNTASFSEQKSKQSRGYARQWLSSKLTLRRVGRGLAPSTLAQSRHSPAENGSKNVSIEGWKDRYPLLS